MKILVTGASGFVGGHLLRKLSGAGHQVVALRRQQPESMGVSAMMSDVTWVTTDLVAAADFEYLEGVTCVFHLAGLSLLGDDPDDARRMNEVNVVATERLARACRDRGVKRFVFVSSIAACECADVAEVTEESGWPVSAYGKSKRKAEDVLLSLHRQDFAVTVMRPTALFGDSHKGSMYELARVVRDRRLVIFGDGSNRTNFYYIEDFISALIAVAGDERSFGGVFIAADRPVPLGELATYVIEAIGVSARIPKVPVFAGRVAAIICDGLRALFKVDLPLSSRRVAAMVRDVAYSNGRLASELGVVPVVGLKEGIRRSVAWYKRVGLL
jgi:dihydroflavonol-4-reductase